MKLHLLDRSSSKDCSFTIKKNHYPYFLKIWHYHPELELVALLKSSGTRFIGDSIEKFEKGEVILIGEGLPHMWLNDDEYFNESSGLIAEAIAIHFKKEFLGVGFFEISEMKQISELLDKARQGIKFLNIKDETFTHIKSILALNGFEKTIAFLTLLYNLSRHSEYELLASEGFVNTFNKKEHKNLNKIYTYIFENFNQTITLQEVADIACMNASAFSRFFKRVNRKTFSRYLNEIRIGYACKLLIENKYNIITICYESGFNNISNFNRQFRAITNMSPTEYLNNYLNIQDKN